MRHLVQCVTGLAVLLACTDTQGPPTNDATEHHAGPAFDRAEPFFTNVGFFISEPGNPLLVQVGFAEGLTLAEICSGNPSLSPNSITHIVFPPSGAFLAASHGQDVPVVVYEFEGDICDGVGESLIASGTARFHFSHTQLPDGRIVDNSGVRGTLDLGGGGQALLAVKSPFFVLPDGTVKFDKTHITLTPL